MDIYRKLICFIIIGLFMGATVIPGIAENNEEKIKTNNDDLPDLQVPDIYFKGVVKPSTWVEVSAWIANYGSVAVTDPFKTSAYLDGDYVWGKTWWDGLEPGQIMEFSVNFRWPTDEDSHTLTVIADPKNAIIESYENNNENSITASASEDIEADFIWTADGLTVTFTDTSTGGGGVSDSAWDFTDDGKDDEWGIYVTYTYSSPGIYTVNHWVKAIDGSQDSCKKMVTVDYKDPIKADFIYIQQGRTVTFADTSTGGNGVLSCSWDFTNDGTDDKWSMEVTHTYPSFGTYIVKHTVNGNDGSTDFCRKMITCKRSKEINLPLLRFNEYHPVLFSLFLSLMRLQ